MSKKETALQIETRERRIALARKMNLMSDAFMSVALKDIPACQHVLRILTGMSGLTVKAVRTQYTISKTSSHDARLDVLAEDEDGNLFNVEIQRSDTVDHGRRTRFYGAMIDSEFLEKGKSYADMPDVYIIYISETDLWKKGKVKYEVKKYFSGTASQYEDGMHIMYVNAAVDDGSEISCLMKYFKTSFPDDRSQGVLSDRVHFLKCEEGGKNVMCEITEQFIEEGKREGLKEGKKTQARETALALCKMGMPAEQIAKAVNFDPATVKEWLADSQV